MYNDSESIPLVATGDINKARFITLDSTENQGAKESNAGDVALVGITINAAKKQPEPSSSVLHAEDDDAISYRGYGRQAHLEIGAGGVTAGDFLKPDADGKGVTAASGETAGAITFETRNAGELAKVMVISPHQLA